MATYLLVWNPNRWHWADLPDVVKKVGRGERVVERWSCGSNRRIVSGDRVFLIRLGREPRGIIGSGTVVGEPFEDIHWQPEKAEVGRMARYIRFQFDALLDPENEPILWRERLKSEAPFSATHWDTRSSGIRIADEVARELEMVWSDLVGPAAG
jgi:5-methylcytosine-specific restriction protein A